MTQLSTPRDGNRDMRVHPVTALCEHLTGDSAPAAERYCCTPTTVRSPRASGNSGPVP